MIFNTNINKKKNNFNIKKVFNENDLIDQNKLKNEIISNIIGNLNDYNNYFSTNQLNIDYSLFSNHVFFNSAENKLISSFIKLNQFPYDKNIFEINEYINKLDGYTFHILKNEYPKNKDSIYFDGSNKLICYDKQNYFIKDSSENYEGILNNFENDYAFSFFININNNNNSNNCVFKKTIIDNNNQIKEGFVCYISNHQEEGFKYLNFAFILDYNKTYTIKKELKSNIDYNITLNINNSNTNNINLFIDGIKVESFITENKDIGRLKYSELFSKKDVNLILGSGEENVYNLQNDEVIVLDNFIGYIDEFIISKKSFNENNLNKIIHENKFANSDYLVYYRFNEPGGEYTNCFLVLDYSGNKLHAVLVDQNNNFLNDTTFYKHKKSFLKYENILFCPVINGSYYEIINTLNSIKEKAKEFDLSNSNLIFNLIPKNLLIDSSNFESKDLLLNNNELDFSFENKNKIKNNTHIVNILLIWASFFDEIKLMLDSIDTINNFDYKNLNENNLSNIFMPILCKQNGFEFKELFIANKNIFNENRNLTYENKLSNLSISDFQNNIWKKILINSQDIIRSKGTINSIKSLFNSVGLNTEKYLDIYETSNNIENNISESNEIVKNDHIIFADLIKNEENIDITIENINSSFLFEILVCINKNVIKSNIKKINLFTLEDENNNVLFELNIIRNNIYSHDCILQLSGNYLFKNDNSYFELEIEDINIFDTTKFIFLKQDLSNNNLNYTIGINDNDTNINFINKNATKEINIDVSFINKDYLNFNFIKNMNIGNKTYINDSKTNNLQFANLCFINENVNENDILCHSKDFKNKSINNSFNLNHVVFNYEIIKDNDTNEISLLNKINKEKISLNNFNINLVDKFILRRYRNTILHKHFNENKVNITYLNNENNKNYYLLNNEYNNIHISNKNNSINNEYNMLNIDMSTVKLLNEDICLFINDIDKFNQEVFENYNIYKFNNKKLINIRENYFNKFNNKNINFDSLNNVFKFFDNILTEMLKKLIPSNIKNYDFNIVYEQHILEQFNYQYKNSLSNIAIRDELFYSRPVENNNNFRNIEYNNNRKN